VDVQRAELEPTVGAPRVARRIVETFLRARNLDVMVDDALLLTSELVTNVVDHASSLISLTLRTLDSLVRVEIEDRVPGSVAQARDEGGTTGRGLFIVDALSDGWGTYDTPDGKVVWFQLSAHSCGGRNRGP